jgi:hypothetical protein
MLDESAINREIDRLLQPFDQVTCAGRFRADLCGDSPADIADYVNWRETERALIAKRLRTEMAHGR